MGNYRLTKNAERDLLSIFVYGIENFGNARAKSYQESLIACLELLGSQPKMGRIFSQLGEGIRRHEHKNHVIIYEEISKTEIEVLAFFHKRQLIDL